MSGSTFRLDMDVNMAMARARPLLERIQDNVVDEIVEDARRYAPVDTGKLRNSIHKAPGHRIVADADYAGFVEYGTQHMAAQPFMRPALYKKRRIHGGGL